MSDLHSAMDPSPICIVVMIVGVIAVVPFLVIVVWNVWGVLIVGVSVVTFATKSGTKLRAVFHPERAISAHQLYSIELSCILLLVSVGAVLAIV